MRASLARSGHIALSLLLVLFRAICIVLIVAALLTRTTGCAAASVAEGERPAGPADELARLSPVTTQTLEGLGAAQGVTVHEGLVYVYGDAETGVVREFRFEAEGGPRLVPTGRSIALTRGGEDLLPHPTGLTFREPFGCFFGDTVNRTGVIWRLDWDRAIADGSLDHAVLGRTVDDLARNGCRPEFVEVNGRALIATADYGDSGNAVRLYDPERLCTAVRTSASGVLLGERAGGEFVQNLSYDPGLGSLVLIQNRTPGLGYRLTPIDLESDAPVSAFASLAFDEPADELEGWASLAGVPGGEGWFVSVSSSRADNARFWSASR